MFGNRGPLGSQTGVQCCGVRYDLCWPAPRRLVGKLRLPNDDEGGFGSRSTCAWLPATERDRVGARRDDAVASFVHVAEVMRVESQTDVLGFTRAQVDTREAA